MAKCPASCSSRADSCPTTGPKLQNMLIYSNCSLGIVPVRPQRIGIRAIGPLSSVLSASALAPCTSSTITPTTPSKNSPIVISASAFLVCFSMLFRLCQVHIVCTRPNSFLSPKYTPTSKSKLTKSSSVCVTSDLLGTITIVRPYSLTLSASAAVIIVLPAPVATSCTHCVFFKKLFMIPTW